jgi:hypothetical protein
MSTSTFDELENYDSCENQDAETFGLLRNEFGQAYLSVQGNSRQDGAYIILGRQCVIQFRTEMTIYQQSINKRLWEMPDSFINVKLGNNFYDIN